MDISASTALVTGANRGFGRALAAELISRGARVYAGARDPGTVALPGAIPVALDITDPESLAAAAEAAAGVTVLVNNAGVGTGASLLDGDLEKLRLEMDTHFFGTLAATRAFAPAIAANGGGAILNVLSALSWISFPRIGGYCAAKSAEWSLTNALRQELAPQGIRVSGLHVGYMDTDLTARVDAPKLDVGEVAMTAVDGLAAGDYEILADELSQKLQAGLAGGVTALYPDLP
ncbi:MAG: short-chain dehydrogenase/reductase [Actinomycetia bacterium]|nr:short-chain dehydrogenase/reductase [Actinomycetes bacterium]